MITDVSLVLMEQKKRAARPNTWRRQVWIGWNQLDWFERLTMGGSIATTIIFFAWAVLR